MSKGIVIHLDDDTQQVLTVSKKYFDQLKTEIEYLCCTNRKDFEETIEKRKSEVKALVFDLVDVSGKKVDLKKEATSFTDQLSKQYGKLNVPIFIFSAHLNEFDDFKHSGTVFRVDKGDGKFETIAEKIKLFHESGFLDIFKQDGLLDQIISSDLHEAFTKQFNSTDDIDKIIASLKNGDKYDAKRVQSVFIRIAIRSLMSKLLSPQETDKSFHFLNGVEHYHKRINKIKFWTGDILKKNDSEEHLLIITPRCNVASKSYDELLVCNVSVGDFPKEIRSRDDKDKIGYALTDNPKLSVYNRYIPPSPIFNGGKVILSDYQMISKSVLEKNYSVIISLSDELTNEMLGKFGAYFFRTGITPWDTKEVINHIATA